MATEPAAAAAWATHESDVNGGDELTADAAAVDPTRVRPGGIDVVTPGHGPNEGTFAFVRPADADVERLYRDVVLARGVNLEADALSKQGALAVYASSLGQEACQAGAVSALEVGDMLFPTYRDTVATVLRGVPATDVLALFNGAWHSGFGPEPAGDGATVRSMPLSTPIATQTLHAVGWAMGRAMDDAGAVAMALIGDGGTSEGDFAEALNFAGVYRAPVVFLVQNNQWAISVPIEAQTSSPTIAHKAVAAGIPGLRCDGQDALAVHATISAAVAHARDGKGPVLVEALTYRFGPHTNNDDPSRYRAADAADTWKDRDPVAVLEQLAADRGLLSDDLRLDAQDRAAAVRTEMRRALFDEVADVDPMAVFDHVYVDDTGHFDRQRAQLRRELAGRATGGDGGDGA